MEKRYRNKIIIIIIIIIIKGQVSAEEVGGSGAQTILRAATLKQKVQIKLSVSPSHSILTPGQPVHALTL